MTLNVKPELSIQDIRVVAKIGISQFPKVIVKSSNREQWKKGQNFQPSLIIQIVQT